MSRKMLGPRGVRRVALLTAVVAVTLAAELVRTVPAGAASWFEKNFYLIGPRYDAVIPPCDWPGALDTIRSRFAEKESQFWNSSLSFVAIDKVRQVAFRPWAEATVPRRFCSGRVLVSDGRWRSIYYSIVEDGGIIGATWGVDWCVVGLDRNWAYNPRCKMARP